MILKFQDEEKTILEVESGYFFEKLGKNMLRVFYDLKNQEKVCCMIYSDEKLLNEDVINNHENKFKLVL